MSLYEDLRYMFVLAKVEAEADGTFTLYAPKDSGRTIFHASPDRMLAIVNAKWGPSPWVAEEAAKVEHERAEAAL